MQPRYSVSAALSLVLAFCSVSGCQPVPKQRGMLERQSRDVHLSSHQLRIMVNEFVAYFAGRIEFRADQILASTSDPEIRKNALRWKINGISACFRAASRPDPMGAYLDIWILNRQMSQLFDVRTGRECFGPWQELASEECLALDRRLQQINHAVGGELRFGEEFVAKFAADFPLSSLYFDREPIASRYIEEVQEPARELFQVIGDLDEDLNELKNLSILYAQHLPKQARWEAELFLIDSTQLASVQRPLQDFSRTANAASRIADVTESLPQLAERERRAMREIVVEERQETLRELDRMRRDTVGQLEVERSIVLDAVREEREAVIEALRGERVAVSHDMNTEMTRALQASDSITRQRVDELVEQAPIIIDHFFWRTWQVCIAFVLMGTVMVWLVLRMKSRATTAPRILAMPAPANEQVLSMNDQEVRRRMAS